MRVDVLLQHPQIQAGPLRPVQHGLRSQREQARADAPALVPVGDMHVVQQRPPRRVLVEDGVREADHAAGLGEDRAAARVVLAQPLAPHGQAVGDNVAIEKGIGIGTAVVATPAGGVKIG